MHADPLEAVQGEVGDVPRQRVPHVDVPVALVADPARTQSSHRFLGVVARQEPQVFDAQRTARDAQPVDDVVLLRG